MELYTLHDTGHSYVQSSAMDGMLLSPAPQAPPPYGGGVPLGGALLRGLDEAWRQDLSPPREDPRTPSPGPRRELVPQLAARPT